MPFKGDMRLGGPHDNEANLDGSSDGPSVPIAGTLIRTENLVPFPSINGGLTGSYYGSTFTSQRVTVDVKADGIGGEYYDWANVRNVEYYPSTQIIQAGYSSGDTNLNVAGNDFANGTYYTSIYHDGNGGFREETTYWYASNNGMPFTTVTDAPLYREYLGQSYLVGTKDIEYFHNGNGGYTTVDGGFETYGDNTNVGSRSVNLYKNVPDTGTNQYQYATETYDVYVWQGWPTDSGAATSTTYIPSGTFIDTINGSNYYWSGNGDYYEYNMPSYGSPTGNSTSGTNYIDINGTQYENGSYSSTEFHDGNGGTYWDGSSSYQSYGYTFTSTSSSYWDEYGNESTYTTYYKSDGNGSYYTE